MFDLFIIKHTCPTCKHLKWSWMESRAPNRNIMTCRRSKWIMFQYQSGHRNGRWRERMHVLDADGFKLLPLFSIRHEAFTSLSFQTMWGGLMFWVNELSVYLSLSAFLFSLPPQGWDVGTLTVKSELLRRLPLCCSAHPDASVGAIINPHMQSRLAMHMIPFAFAAVSCFFSPFFSALLSMTHCVRFAGLELIARVFTETPVWLEQLISSAYSPFNFVAAHFFNACIEAGMSLF